MLNGMSACGTKRTSMLTLSMYAFRGKADMRLNQNSHSCQRLLLNQTTPTMLSASASICALVVSDRMCLLVAHSGDATRADECPL